MTRRTWFASLFAPFIARFLPKCPLPPQNAAELVAMYAPVLTERYFTENPLFYRLKRQSDFGLGGGIRVSAPIIYGDDEPWTG